MTRALKFALPLALLLAALPRAAAAALTISAETDRTAVEINENLVLTVHVAGDSASVPEPKMPNMQNFNSYSSGRSQSISIINGKITTSVSFTYILSPRFLGMQKIPSISVFNGKDTAFTPEIEINVTKAAPAAQRPAAQRQAQGARHAATAGQARGDAQIFLKAETDKKSAYPGEQVNLSIKFYTSVPLTSNPQYMQPVLKNLIPEDLPPVRAGETTLNGERYAFSEIKTALFALTPGPAEIKPASVVVQVPANEVLDPFDPNFFQKFMSMSNAQGRSREFASEALALDIKPLPAGAPAGFSGAVGNYTVAAAADRQEAKAGEAVNFSVSVAGSGNLKAVTAPKLPELQDFKVFDTMSSLDIRKDGDVIGGKKTFTYILVPRAAGRKTVPPVTFVFFEPRAGQYRELQTSPVNINVQKGDQETKNVYFSPSNGESKVTASDIRYVSEKPRAGFIADSADGIAGLPLWLHAFPAGLLLATFWLSRFNRYKSANPLLFRFRRAKSLADDALEKTEALLKAGKTAEAVALLYDSFMDYLSDKCGVKVSALTIKKASELIKARFPGASQRAMDEIRELWTALELRHFSPSATEPEGATDLTKKYSLLIELLEKELRGARR
ncbi:MAG TPA: BatD family protein [Elusimicrobiales bacterium]|nr:BatD family protein [Elusimicrobiales bacterium]